MDTIKKIVPQLILYGRVTKPGLPVTLLSDDYAQRFGIQSRGVAIVEVTAGSEAGRAGLTGIGRDRRGYYYLGDVITALDDAKITSYDDLFSALENRKIGDVVTLTVSRDGKTRKVKLTLVRSE